MQPHDRGAQSGEHARMSLALWLRQGRAQRGMSLDDVAKITKIQTRILERLEAGRFEGLPAEVFVRGFVRNFARCVGLDESEALTRYSACGRGELAGTTAGATARAFVETMSELAPHSAARSAAAPRILRDHAPAIAEIEPGAIDVDVAEIDAVSALPPAEAEAVVTAEGSVRITALAMGTSESEIVAAAEAVDLASVDAPSAGPASPAVEVVEAVPATGKKKRARKPKATAAPGGSRRRKKTEIAQVVDATVALDAVAEVAATPDEAAAAPVAAADVAAAAPVAAADVAPVAAAAEDATASVEALPAPEVVFELAPEVRAAAADAEVGGLWTPKMPPLAQPTVPWRRPAFSAPVIPTSPSIVIDDADPDSAERELEDRREARTSTLRSFLPPILLDREDRSARQGGLTLAVIILLIAATLTLSYLMRRPGSSGDGMTSLPAPTQPVA